jgi:hypothetical protein
MQPADALTRAVALGRLRGGATAHRHRARALTSLTPLTRPLQAAAPAASAAPRRLLHLGAAVSPSSPSSSTSPPSFSPSELAGLTGRWRKDGAASDSMDAACDAVALPWILRKAVGVVKVLELEDTPAHFRTRLKAGGVLDIVETYPWDGSTVLHGRRDKRRGGHRGHVERVVAPGSADGSGSGLPGARIVVSWDDPHGGTCSDAFTLSPDGRTLLQATVMRMAGTGAVVEYKTVYRREASTKKGG